jgi:hypothetical protein
MSGAASINKFNETLIKLFNGIENIFRLQTIEATTGPQLYTYIFYILKFFQ